MKLDGSWVDNIINMSLVYGTLAQSGGAHLCVDVIHPLDGTETPNPPAALDSEIMLPRDQLAGIQPSSGRAGVGDAVA